MIKNSIWCSLGDTQTQVPPWKLTYLSIYKAKNESRIYKSLSQRYRKHIYSTWQTWQFTALIPLAVEMSRSQELKPFSFLSSTCSICISCTHSMTASETHKNKTWPCKETMNEDPTGEYIFVLSDSVHFSKIKTHLNGVLNLFSSGI